MRHTLLVPGPLSGLAAIRACCGPSIPLQDGYRFPLSVRHWRGALLELAPDLIEAGDPYVTGLAARDVGLRLGIPVVAFFHSDVPRMLGERLGLWTGAPARSYLRSLYSGFDRVLAPSHCMLEKLDAWGIRNTALQPLGVDTQVFSPTMRDLTFRRTLGISEDSRVLVYAGRFSREKNLPVLVSAVKKLGEPYHLLLVGADHHARISSQVSLWPYERDPAQLARVLASCDVVVHAGDQETFGLIAVEAMSCGLPVVAVGIGGIKELVDDSVGMRIDRVDAGQMAEAVRALFARDLVSIGIQARSRALRSHSWHAAFRRLIQTYAHLAGQPTGRWNLLAHSER